MDVLLLFKPTQLIFMNGIRMVNEILRNENSANIFD